MVFKQDLKAFTDRNGNEKHIFSLLLRDQEADGTINTVQVCLLPHPFPFVR